MSPPRRRHEASVPHYQYIFFQMAAIIGRFSLANFPLPLYTVVHTIVYTKKT
jgi:hypothetical protein